MRKTTRALAVPAVLLLAVGIAACGGEDSTTSTSTGAAAQETSGGGTKPNASSGSGDAESISVMNLKVGDCFNEGSDASEVTNVDRVSCDSPHEYEVYNNSNIDDTKYSTAPTGDDLDNEIYEACHDSFEMYVGVPVESSTYATATFNPTPGSWKQQGDRTINCLIASPDGKPMTGSARDSKK